MTRIAPDIRAASRRLRRETTPEERLLWRQLREVNRLIGMHFRRQAPVGRFVLDFADYGRRLAIEIDGGHHASEQVVLRDQVRGDWLAAQGFAVLRLWNSEVRGNIEGVMQVVLDAVETAGNRALTASDPPPPSPPHKGEGKRKAPIAGSAISARGDRTGARPSATHGSLPLVGKDGEGRVSGGRRQ